MTPASLILAILISGSSAFAGLAYRRAWIRLRGPGATPTGFGALLAFALLAAALATDASTELKAALGIVAAGTIVYWPDDVVGLSARLRLAIAFAAGVATGAVYLVGDGLYSPFVLAGFCLLAGLISVILTNIVNFYDGADLNLGTFIALTAGFTLLFGAAHREWGAVALASLAFVAPFAVMNSRPKTIYFGDSGSFAFAGLLTTMAVAFFRDYGSLPPEAAIPAALPAFDVFFVFTIRLREGHDLLTRNYLHLYQRLSRRFGGFGYLVPQVANALLCVGGAMAFQWVGLGRILSVTLAILLLTVPFYFACRILFLGGPPEGPLHEVER